MDLQVLNFYFHLRKMMLMIYFDEDGEYFSKTIEILHLLQALLQAQFKNT